MLRHILIALLLATTAFSQTKNQKPQLLWQKLEQTIRDVDHGLNGVLGVAVIDFTSGETFFYNADEIYPTASSIKIAVLTELYRQNQLGRGAKLSDLYIVRKEDLVPDSDIMGGLTPGVTRITNRDLATMMIAVSDNSATNVLIDHVGMENVNAMLDSLGLRNTRLRRKMMDINAAKEGRENVATPRELAKLLESIYRAQVVNKQTSEDLLQMLSTHKDSGFRRGLPDYVRAADKPGELEAVRNCSGIIYAQNRPFVLSVMTTYVRHESDGADAIARIARAAWEMFDVIGRASDYGRIVSPANSSNP